jgi:hypothetical protein
METLMTVQHVSQSSRLVKVAPCDYRIQDRINNSAWETQRRFSNWINAAYYFSTRAISLFMFCHVPDTVARAADEAYDNAKRAEAEKVGAV